MVVTDFSVKISWSYIRRNYFWSLTAEPQFSRLLISLLEQHKLSFLGLFFVRTFWAGQTRVKGWSLMHSYFILNVLHGKVLLRFKYWFTIEPILSFCHVAWGHPLSAMECFITFEGLITEVFSQSSLWFLSCFRLIFSPAFILSSPDAILSVFFFTRCGLGFLFHLVIMYND